MLCFSGFELYSRWVPLFMADSETDKKKLFVRSFLIWPIIYRKVAAQSGFRVFVTIRDRRNEIGGTWMHTGSFSLCATVIIKAAGLGSVHKRRFFSKYFSVPNFEDVEITGKITIKKSR